MKYLIVEDERFAYEELKRMVTKLRPDYLLEKQTKTVIDTIGFLKEYTVDSFHGISVLQTVTVSKYLIT